MDIGADRVYLELKDDFKSADTPNFCLEIKAIRHSKAPLFVYHIRNPDCFWVFHVWELEDLIASPLYRHCKIGDYGDEGVLVPKEVLQSVGRPFEEAIQSLTKAVA
jgi:hypothetical protein